MTAVLDELRKLAAQFALHAFARLWPKRPQSRDVFVALASLGDAIAADCARQVRK